MSSSYFLFLIEDILLICLIDLAVQPLIDLIALSSEHIDSSSQE